MKNWIKKNKFNIIIMIVWAVVSFALIFFHENWRDEAQAWLIAKDLSFTELFSQLSYEGHFMLWYLILMPFAKLGFPYITTNFISWFIVAISIYLVLFKSPLKTYQKILFVFSTPFVYTYPVISRCYCLIPLAISLMALFYENRKEKPIRYMLSIALLANTHVIMLGLVGIMLLEFYIEVLKDRKVNTHEKNKKFLLSFILIVVLLILAALPLIGSLSTNKVIDSSKESSNLSTPLYIIGQYYSIISENYPVLGSYKIFITITLLAILVYTILSAKEYTKSFIEFFIALTWQVFVYAVIFSLGISNHRAETIFFIFLFFFWINRGKKPKNKIIEHLIQISFIIFMILELISTGFYIYKEFTEDYSTAYQVAEYITENTESGSIFITAKRPETLTSIVAYLNNDSKFYYIQRGDYFTFSIWDEYATAPLDDDFGIEDLREIFGENENIYYIYSAYNSSENVNDIEFISKLMVEGYLYPVFESGKNFVSEESYIVYKINLKESIFETNVTE